eukprot:jgi/Astpho2/1248/Aster-x0469
MASYSLGARCCTEAVGLGLVIILGDGSLANELLPRTKGHGMGYGFVSLSFGIAFFFSILCFGYISAYMNPALLLALWILGKLDFVDGLALAGAELAGAAVGAGMVW